MKNKPEVHANAIGQTGADHRERLGSTSEACIQKKSYQAPVLVSYGDVRDITLGPTFGQFESGCAGIRRDGPGGCP